MTQFNLLQFIPSLFQGSGLLLPPGAVRQREGAQEGAPPRTGPDSLPAELGVLPAPDGVLFPTMAMPATIAGEPWATLLNDAAAANAPIALVGLVEPQADPQPENLRRIGTAARIAGMRRLPNGAIHVVFQGISRIRLIGFTRSDPYLRASVLALPEPAAPAPGDDQAETTLTALRRTVVGLFEQVVANSRTIPDSAAGIAAELTAPGQVADFCANTIDLPLADRQAVLETLDVAERLRLVATFLEKELQVLELGRKTHEEIHERVHKHQREAFLRAQLKKIQAELGELDPQEAAAKELRERVEEAQLPEEAKKEAERELSRLEKLPEASPEYHLIRTYLDWLLALPWHATSQDNLDLAHARGVLDEDHHGLEKVKERILEYLAVRTLKSDPRGPILCFAGPPGVGKTSLGQSIARALGRKFVRISLGGVRDEAEIRGHRRTYVGALPGRIVQALRRAETSNPVFMLDEVDKLTTGFQGDPAAALLEVLDPEQNHAFVDHYLDVPFDLTQVFFIATANVLEHIPGPLRDRMEVIELPGYTEEEKAQIARRHLLPKQRAAHGLEEGQIELPDETLRRLIRGYTREAGVRNLDREIAALCRKVTRTVAERTTGAQPENGEPADDRRPTAVGVAIAPEDLEEYLGPRRFRDEVLEAADEVGVVTGLSWTPAGGEVLFVEASAVRGKGRFELTGQLGDVMKESVKAAFTYVRSRAGALGIPDGFPDKYDVHIHVPAGAVPKDGPSAGVTMATALASALTGRLVRREVAMTGEITLRGKVLPIGGVKEKVLAAHRAGVKTVILPAENEKDLRDVPAEVREALRFVLVSHADDVLAEALHPARPAAERGIGRRLERIDPRERPARAA
jgi:ATP-dependent Lon protease